MNQPRFYLLMFKRIPRILIKKVSIPFLIQRKFIVFEAILKTTLERKED